MHNVISVYDVFCCPYFGEEDPTLIPCPPPMPPFEQRHKALKAGSPGIFRIIK